MNLDNEYLISEEQKNFFDENGFVFLPSVMSVEEILWYRERIDGAVIDRTGADKRSLAEKTAYEREFLQCGHLWRENPEIRKLTLSKRLASVAKQLLKGDKVRLWHDQALYKLPGGDATEPHQDVSYWPMKQRDAGTIWIALDEVTAEMGAMYFIPGTHSLGIDGYNYTIEDAINKKTNILEVSEKFTKKDPVTYNLRPGDATFHHGLTIHYTKRNTTDKIRKAMTVIYFNDGVKYDANSPASGHPCAWGSFDNEPINTERTPIII